MLLRTISVETAEQTELNAALLCGFAIPASDRNFIAYSLNEQVDENDSRVYIASLFKTDDGFRLGRLDTDEACEAAIQVFRQLVREATTGNRRTSDLAYHLIDLQDAAIAPSRREEHRSLVLEREWVMKLVTFESPHGYGPALDGEEPCADVPPLVHEALFEDAAPDVFAADDADEASDGPAEPIDEPEAAEDETVTEAGCVEPEPRPEAETAAPEGGAPAEFATKAEQSAKVADAEAIGAFVDNASHLREELADLAQLLHPALHAADATGSANLPSPDAAEESSMPPSPSPLPHPRRNRYRPGSPACRCASGCRPHAWPAPRARPTSERRPPRPPPSFTNPRMKPTWIRIPRSISATIPSICYRTCRAPWPTSPAWPSN